MWITIWDRPGCAWYWAHQTQDIRGVTALILKSLAGLWCATPHAASVRVPTRFAHRASGPRRSHVRLAAQPVNATTRTPHRRMAPESRTARACASSPARASGRTAA
ncbi:hypothetical protein F7R23_05995 [Burkholderia diffusa]|nr:hypothetical protein F7R23_05995 [Burkholderia diffusa]